MQQATSRMPSPAMIIAVIALIVSLSGSAYAVGDVAWTSAKRGKVKLGKNTVGPRQIKRQAVRTGKIANNAITGAKVRNNSLTGADINLSALGTVPSAVHAAQANNANTVGGHAAACPPGTVLIRGICFDSSSNGPVGSLKEAADGCAAKGGYLPTPLELYSTKSVLNLGEGTGSDTQFTDSYYEDTEGSAGSERTITVDGKGSLEEHEINSPAEYTCAYPLVR